MLVEDRDIHERIYQFVVRVVKLCKFVQKTPENIVIINQLSRSVTSMGANDQEADGTITLKDFIHTYTIVRKESKETYYWLKILADTNPKLKSRMQDLIKECMEIIKIITTIVYKTKSKKK